MGLTSNRWRKWADRLRPSCEYVSLIPAVANTLSVVYYLNPFGVSGITDWSRALGPAVLAGISIDARIALLQRIVAVYPLVFLLFWVLFSQWGKSSRSVVRVLANLDVVFLPTIIASYFSRFSDASGMALTNSWSVCGCVVANLAILMLDCVTTDEKPGERDCVLLVIHMYLWALLLKLFFRNISLLSRLTPLCVPMAGAGVAVLHAIILKARSSSGLRCKLSRAMTVSCLLPAVVTLTAEALYVLNAHGLFVRDHRLVTTSVCLLALCLLVGTQWARPVTVDDGRRAPSRFWIPVVGMAIVVAATQYEYEFDYHQYSSLFELGNRTVVMDTITTGSLPVVDYFSAHALRDVLTPLLSQLVTDDPTWAIVDIYGGLTTVANIIVFYLFLKELFEEHWAAAVVVLFPFMVNGLYWSSLCLLGLLGALRLLRKPSMANCLLFWLFTAFGAFYQYDFGISIGIACIVVLFAVSLGKKTALTPLRFVGSGIVVGLALLSIALMRCLVAHIPPVDRLREWLSVTLGSSEVWATVSFGDATAPGVALAYSLVPAMGMMMAALALFNRDDIEDKVHLFLVLVFALAYYLFIPRILVYHNYAVCKGKTGVLLNYFPLLVLAFFRSLQRPSSDKASARAMGVPLGSWFVAILACSTVVTGVYPQAASSVVNAANEATSRVVLYADATPIRDRSRVSFSKETEDLCDSFERFFSLLLEDDETYLDFSNITGLYALTGRERPTYVGQLPGLLTDQFSQECCIRQIEEANPPLAVVSANDGALTASMEDIPHNARYYLLAEYLYDNYQPLVMNDDFALWCLKDRHASFQAILSDGGEGTYELIDYGYDCMMQKDGAYVPGLADAHDYALGEVPYLWANEDGLHASEGGVTSEAQQVEDGSFVLVNRDKTQGTPSYLLIECNAQEPSSVTMLVQAADHEASRVRYRFDLHEGQNTYLIRVSSDYNWWAFGADTVMFDLPVGASVSRVAVLEGD